MADQASRELDAAGVLDPTLRSAYRQARAVHASYGRTYFLATRMLARAQRPPVHALYGFARYVDEIVDSTTDSRSPTERAAALDSVAAALDRALDREPPEASDHGRLLLASVADTAHRYGLDRALFAAFLTSMRMDTHRLSYPSYQALSEYMHGSAGVIGLLMLPVLGTDVPEVEAAPSAEALGIAFQLTNFLRDVGEDLDRGRLYLPADELAVFGVDRDLLVWCRRHRRGDARVRRALAHLVARTRAVYRRAEPGIALLTPGSRPCVRTAHRLYGAILDGIVDADYDVLHRRVSVPASTRLAVGVPAMARASIARAPWPVRGA